MKSVEAYFPKMASFILLVMINPFNLFSQSSVQLYHCMGDLTGNEKKIMANLSIQHTMVFDGRYIDPKNTGRIDSLELTKAIESYFPNKDDKGFAVLDLEDENYRALRLTPGSKVETKFAVNEFIRMVRIAKNSRPNIKWAIYNVPYNTYYDKTDEWKNQDRHLDILFRSVDVFAPSLYDFYPDTTFFADDKTYFNDNLQMTLRLAVKYNKEVIPFIWHRWHDSNQKVGLQLIPKNEFMDNLHYILSAQYQEKKVSGIIWFGAQSYFHHIKPGLEDDDHRKIGGQKSQVKENTLSLYGGYILEGIGQSAPQKKPIKKKRKN